MTVPTRSHHRPRLTGPDALTLSRVPLAVAIAWIALAFDPPTRPALVTLFAVAIATDLIDGRWARRLGTSSGRGAALDSAADAILAVAVAVAVARTVEWSAAPWAWWAIAAVAALRLAGLVVTFARFRVVSIAHTLANKATGALIAAVALWALASGNLGDWPIAIGVGVAAIAALEELVIAATSRTYSRNRRGLWDGR